MSPDGQNGVKIPASSNLYTVILALAFFAVLTTACLVTWECYYQYETIFSVP
jgi:hypothetical protein